LVMVAWLIIVMRFVDLLWMIVPEFEHGHAVSLMGYLVYLAATIGIGGIWLGWFFWQLRQRALLPVNDPHLEEALAARGGH
jgi:type VI protein secretion system component VasK